MTFPQVIHILFTWGTPLACSGLYGYVRWLRRLISKEIPSKSLLHELKLEIAEYAAQTEALYDRFTRFQKRENMREVRQEKTSQEALRREAAEILAATQQQQPAADDTPFAAKRDLYRRFRH